MEQAVIITLIEKIQNKQKRKEYDNDVQCHQKNSTYAYHQQLKSYEASK